MPLPISAPVTGQLVLTDADYDYICELLQKKAGIRLSRTKQSLVENRLKSRIKDLGIETFSAYVEKLKTSANQELPFFLDALTTNTTQFFREPNHFTILTDIVRKNFAGKGRKLSVWCAASSTGEEVYSLAMVLEELRQSIPTFDYRILATDISDKVLIATEQGIYTDKDVKGIRGAYLQKYFQVSPARDKYRVKAILRDKVKVRRHNLSDSCAAPPMTFDIIFLRNVLIYFPPLIIKVVAEKMHSAMAKGSHLFIGHSDSIGPSSTLFESTEVSVFKRTD